MGTYKNSDFFVRTKAEVAPGNFLHSLHPWSSSTDQTPEWVQEVERRIALGAVIEERKPVSHYRGKVNF